MTEDEASADNYDAIEAQEMAADAFDEMATDLDEARTLIARYRTALEEIREGRGKFSLDPLEHAANTIADMKRLANEALTGEPS